jgi:hypothetical protein
MESDKWIYLFTFLRPKEMSKRLAVETWTLTRTQILLPAIQHTHTKKKKKNCQNTWTNILTREFSNQLNLKN